MSRGWFRLFTFRCPEVWNRIFTSMCPEVGMDCSLVCPEVGLVFLNGVG